MGTEAFEGAHHIRGFDALEVSDRGGGCVDIHGRDDAIRQSGDDAVVDELLYPAGVAEFREFHLQGLFDGLPQFGLSLVGEDVILFLKEMTGDLHQLGGIVVIELVTIGETAPESGIGVQHSIHLLGVTSEDNEHIGIGPCEDGKQRLDDTMTKVLLVDVARTKAICLIDEKHITPRLFKQDLHVVFRLADVLSHDAGTVHSDDLALGKESQRMVYLSEFAGNSGLACTRITSEDRMEDHLTASLESSATTLQKQASLIGHCGDSLLHLIETNHLIEFTDALLIGGGSVGEPFEGNILDTELRDLIITHQREGSTKVTGTHLISDKPTDVRKRPVGNGPLFAALNDSP